MRYLERYADMLAAAVNVREGQNVAIRGEPVHWPLINAIAAAVYRRGARYVQVFAQHSGLTVAQARYVRRLEWLDYMPAISESIYRIMAAEDWAYIAITGQDNPHLFDNIDRECYARIRSAYERTRQDYLDHLMNDRSVWLVCVGPTAGWAAQVLNRAPDEAACEALWELLIPILRLDHPDPQQAWWTHTDALRQRADRLTAAAIRRLRFRGPGTDLSIAIPPQANWKGGRAQCADGREFICNLPTEEFYTTPDYRLTEGTVTLTRPADIFGTLVHDVVLHFEGGAVVNFTAGRGREALARMLEIDAGARRLGEVAIVDCASPIYRSGLIFGNILLDENAACHIAFGKAYPKRIAGGERMSAAEQDAAGINQSITHIDIMIGSEEVSIEAEVADGSTRPIFHNGRFIEDL